MRNLKAALLGAALVLGATLPLEAQSNGTAVAAAEPAVPNRRAATDPAPNSATVATDAPAVSNTPRQATPAAIAAPPLASPDASKIDASDGNADAVPDAANDDDTDGIVATVNDEAISDFELRQRVSLTLATNPGFKPSPEDLKHIRAQVLAQLEDEKIELQEAAKQQVTVSPAEIDKRVNIMLGDNHLTIDQLRDILTKGGTSEAALRAQLEAQVAWGKTVEKQYGDMPVVTPAQVDAELKRQADGANKPHYLVAEIFLPVDSPNQDAKVQKDAQSLEDQLQQGASFSALARQFSQSPTAAAGGEIGWVRQGQLAPELDAALTKMKPNTISMPVRSNFGYYILMLHERQEPLGTRIEAAPTAAANASGTLPLARMLLPVGTAPTKDIIDTGMKIAAQIRAGYDGCAKLAQVTKQIQGAVYSDLGEMKLSDLSAEIQKALAATPPGEMAPPMLSEAGIELIGRCDARVEVRTAFTLPTRDQVEQQLFEEQISALANRYKRDIKRDADVEIR